MTRERDCVEILELTPHGAHIPFARRVIGLYSERMLWEARKWYDIKPYRPNELQEDDVILWYGRDNSLHIMIYQNGVFKGKTPNGIIERKLQAAYQLNTGPRFIVREKEGVTCPHR